MITAFISAVAYLAAAGLALRDAPQRNFAIVGGIAVVMHAASLLLQLSAGEGWRFGFFEALSIVIWQASALLWLACARWPLAAIAVPLYPLAALAVVGTTLTSSGAGIGIVDWRLKLHVTLSVLAAGLFTLAAIHSAVLAAQNRLLHRPGTRNTPSRSWVGRLPPLQTMEHLLFRMLWIAMGLLSAALLTGVLFVDNLLDQHLVHKTVLSFTAWGVFATLLWGRWRYGWRGRTALRWTSIGYGVLLLAYFGSKFVLEQLLGQQWG
jgi:ABC-type uncharacterized transport system permease subunit